MSKRDDIIKILGKYYLKIKTEFDFQIGDSVSLKKIENAKNKFASGVSSESVVGLYDTSLFGTGKVGYLFTDTKIYYLEDFSSPKKIWYDEIKNIILLGEEKKDYNNELSFELSDGSSVSWKSTYLNKTPLLDFFRDLYHYLEKEKNATLGEAEVIYKKQHGILSGGIETGNYQSINKLFDEEKFHANQGHGFAAERANDLYDKLTGHDTKLIGDNNKRNGADRIVDGIYIQSKYCNSGSKCINECFDKNDGHFRYIRDGKPMQIEVPSDKYDAAVEAMRKKIQEGRIPGVNDPNEAKNIVRQGHFTYEQAKNIAKAGTVESLTYDSINGVIISASAVGVTATITLALNLWNGESFENSLKLATYSGLKVGGTAFLTTVLASQLSKAGLNSLMVGASKEVVNLFGSKAASFLVNAFRSSSQSAIYGAAAKNMAAKLLRGNLITSTVTFVILSSFDIADIFRGRISGKQLFVNMTNTASAVAGGTAGWMVGAAVGSAILPGAGTIVGGLVGSVIGGVGSSKSTDVVLSKIFKESDADEMIHILQQEFSKISHDYLLNEKEAEKSVDALKKVLSGAVLKDMFSCSDKRKFADDLLVPIIENEIKKRAFVNKITNSQVVKGLSEVLEDLSDDNSTSND